MLIRQKKITEIKNDLINNITHEFKTPLSTISLACEALNEPQLLNNSNSIGRYSKIIDSENSRLRSLVENLLNAASLEKGEINLDIQNVDVHDIISDVVNQFELQLENQNGYFKLEMAAEKSNINADPFHLSIIFNNIIDNALKYNERDPQIIISTVNSTEGIIISFSDNGIGIKKSEFKNIFETFYRVPTGNIQNVQGSGMGLHHVKKLTEANGGTVSVTSVLNEGTIFKVGFPNE
jgi:two-component system phosphate regulon sensor histidine kinase PhoR